MLLNIEDIHSIDNHKKIVKINPTILGQLYVLLYYYFSKQPLSTVAVELGLGNAAYQKPI